MPKKIIIELNKDILTKFDESDETTLELRIGKSYLKLEFLADEKNSLRRLIHENKAFETIRIELPGTIDLTDVINEDIITKKYPKLKITIREQAKRKETFFEYL